MLGYRVAVPGEYEVDVHLPCGYERVEVLDERLGARGGAVPRPRDQACPSRRSAAIRIRL